MQLNIKVDGKMSYIILNRELATIEQVGDILKIKTPYNGLFVEDIKTIPGRRWTGELWEVPAVYKTKVQELVDQYFPKPEDSWWHVYTAYSEESKYSIEIDGISIISFSKFWAKAKDRDYPRVSILYQRLKSGGSRYNPIWSGSLTFTLFYRKFPNLINAKFNTHYKEKTPPPMEVVNKAVEEAKELAKKIIGEE